jgi:hypothetical protein
MNLPMLQRAERHACAEQLGEDVAYHNPRLELAHHPETHGDDRVDMRPLSFPIGDNAISAPVVPNRNL